MPARGLTGSFWPEGDEELVLRAALLPGDRGLAAWERLRPRLDVDDPEPALYPLLALLYRRLDAVAVDDRRMRKLRGIYRRTWYVNQLRRERLKDAVATAQPLDALVFDGWEILLHYHGELGLRDVPALHLLVRAEQVRAAAEALADAGWGGDAATATRSRGRRPARFENASGDVCFVHWRPFREFFAPERAVEPEDVWETSVAFDFGGVQARMLGAADELLGICLSGARASDAKSMTWIADAVAVLRGRSAVDWHRFVRQARRLRAALRATDALLFLRDELDEPIPEAVLGELRHAPAGPRDVLAHRAAATRWPVIGKPPETLTRFLRLTAGDSLPGALSQLPSFLRDEWGLQRRAQLPVAATRLLAARINQRTRRAH